MAVDGGSDRCGRVARRQLARQFEMERRSLPLLRLRPQLRLEQIRGLSRDGEAQPRAGLAVGFAAGEGGEELLELFRGDAGALVDHGDQAAVPVVAAYLDPHFTLG